MDIRFNPPGFFKQLFSKQTASPSPEPAARIAPLANPAASPIDARNIESKKAQLSIQSLDPSPAPAASVMNVFIKGPDGKSHTLDITPNESVQTVVNQARHKLGLPDSMALSLSYSSKTLHPDLRISDYNIQRYSTLQVNLRVRNSDLVRQDVLASFHTTLQDLGKQNKTPLTVFISYGSYDYGHMDEGSPETTIRRQQCPDPVLAHARTTGSPVHVLLLDIGFEEGAKTEFPQIWNLEPLAQTVGPPDAARAVRQYEGTVQSVPVTITTFPTNVTSEEYSGNAASVGGIPHTDLVNLLPRGSSIQVGNFYSSDNPPHFIYNYEAHPPV